MKKIANEKQSGWLKKNLKEDEITKYCDKYMRFLNNSKTERDASKLILKTLIASGFKDISMLKSIKKGDKVYLKNKNKCIYAAEIGNDLTDGLNIIGVHIDSPRLDLKPTPLYEDISLALFKTHYYGGIKKYQWTTIPLSLHGVIALPSGKTININVGEEKNDPVFTITDILPHLAQGQYEKTIGKAICGEDLNALVGSIPNKQGSVKENILSLLNKKYGINEVDFYSSELELVPAFNAKSVGFDKSMIGGYGQDDKACAYAALTGLISSKKSDLTKVTIFADKEEIGSMGNTSMSSEMFDYFINELLNKTNKNAPGVLNKVYCNSMMLSADVDGAMDPNYQDVSEIYNASKIGYGVELNKYTGSGGKNNASDANAEFVAIIRNLFETNDIKYQVAELGKVDEGGGGTVSYILANKGVDVIDCGIPMLSMHSPYEVTSKFDVYEVYKAYKCFYENKNR